MLCKAFLSFPVELLFVFLKRTLKEIKEATSPSGHVNLDKKNDHHVAEYHQLFE